MTTDKNFLGRNGFMWFTGVVEDRIDPEYLGRVKVRCIGLHTDDKLQLPTADLPWAQVVLPVTSAAISGLGFSPSALVEGSWVYGYFRDGENCQEPLVLGSIPGYPLSLADSSKGLMTLTEFIQNTEMSGTPIGWPSIYDQALLRLLQKQIHIFH